ncbi:tyrosine-type recombinase/integrase [Marinospirillum alkaliphilum]|uniref:Site-specific recombinase XerD n=1 Tax=Marinospirillum alkaliphilum DSM 21637 TaxID=1122209 RepID=A0A1K1XMR4_9GAMM|nr:site-specific integrase [Marinospirillum alkaliphilum]SFX50659.1 Site-specific recombinase XerD [Marinospirillum alkaliphilum DSM 21637]
MKQPSPISVSRRDRRTLAQGGFALAMAPLERIGELPDELSGRFGENRPPATQICQIDAANDLEAVQSWLLEYQLQPQTFRTYRKEAERLLLWCWLEQGKAFSSLNRQDLAAYQAFLADPQPAVRWCGHGRAPRHSAEWRPFQGRLSQASQQHALRILKGLFQYLHAAGYLAGNPLALVRQKDNRQDGRRVRERHLDQETWDALVDYLQHQQADDPKRLKQLERWRLLLAFLYLLAPRVHEVAQARMNDFFQRRGHWWWAVEGKGKKYAEIPVSEALIAALKRYRSFLQLEPLPDPEDFSPLIRDLSGQRGISANMIYRTMKDLTDEASRAFATSNPEIARRLEKTSTHWFRHTSITHQADAGVELRFLARNARHASLSTTRIYLHEEDQAWQEQNSKQDWQAPWADQAEE